MTAADATVDAMATHGIRTIYALPGVQNDYLFGALFKASDRMRTVHTRHEQGAAYMALGAALATGKPVAYAVVPGPGLLNSAAALLTAYSMNAPVLALIGEIPDADIGRHLGHLHEICRGSNLHADIRFDALPILSAARHLAQDGYATGASERNWTSVEPYTALPATMPDWQKKLLTDPQTSGGLLVACAADSAASVLEIFREKGFSYARDIGRLSAGPSTITVT
jgi:sulfopyruvate decarboxylase TPP-binding subunit